MLKTGLTRGLPALVAAVQDGAAMSAVLESLADPVLARIDFRINGFAINPPMFAKVREKIESGAIKVVFDASLKDARTGLPFCV